MLVLTRKRSEKIRIGDDIIVMVVRIRGDQVCIGIEAPRDVPVHRKEVYLKIQQQNMEERGTENASNKIHATIKGDERCETT